MFSSPSYKKDQIDKIGNTMIYLCDHMEEISKTKILKLIYLIQESAVKAFGLPFFNLEFRVWKNGPVSTDIYAELSSELFMFADYIKLSSRNGNTFVKSKKAFIDDEFNGAELDLLAKIAASCKHLNAAELVGLTHKKDSPWYKAALENNLLDAFDKGLANTSNVVIDLSILLKDSPEKLNMFNKHKEFLEASSGLTS